MDERLVLISYDGDEESPEDRIGEVRKIKKKPNRKKQQK